jgi:hypothetical protein
MITVKLKIKVLPLLKHHTKKTYGDLELKLHVLLISEPEQSEWTSSRSCRCTPTMDPAVGIQDVGNGEKNS